MIPGLLVTLALLSLLLPVAGCGPLPGDPAALASQSAEGGEVDQDNAAQEPDGEQEEECGVAERVNPETGRCESCVHRDPHPAEVCACGWEWKERAFPYCEGFDADYVCTPCQEPDQEEPPACEYPTYSSSCSEVWHLQCGQSARCEDGVLSITWHEHVFCGEDDTCPGCQHEEIVGFSCTHVCEHGCAAQPGYDLSDGPSAIHAYCAQPDVELPECPANLAAVAGTPCDAAGQICNADGSAELCSGCPDEDCEVALCEEGVWSYYQVSACDMG